MKRCSRLFKVVVVAVPAVLVFGWWSQSGFRNLKWAVRLLTNVALDGVLVCVHGGTVCSSCVMGEMLVGRMERVVVLES